MFSIFFFQREPGGYNWNEKLHQSWLESVVLLEMIFFFNFYIHSEILGNLQNEPNQMWSELYSGWPGNMTILSEWKSKPN